MRPGSAIEVRCVLLLLVLAVWAASAPAVVVDFAPADLSADGSMVVGSRPTAGGGVEAVRWTAADGAVVPFGAFTPTAMSADGSVVVGNQGDQAVRWTATTGVVPLSLGGTLSNATGVSADGSVVVGSVDDQAYRWTVDAGMLDLGNVPGTSQDSALGISADGSTIVGWSFPEATAFRWTATEGIVELAPTAIQATAVSADGSVIVGSGQGAFRWTAAGGLVSIGGDFTAVTGMPDGTYATGVSGDGSVIVGGGYISHVPPDATAVSTEAFIWDEINGIRGDIGLSAYTGISTDSSTLIGYYFDGFYPVQPGSFFGVILTIPEPLMLPLLALGGLLCRCRRVRSCRC